MVSADDIDGLIIPGGFGAAKNLSDFSVKGPEAQVHPQVQRLLEEMADICVDEKNRIVTTPAYMLGPGIKDAGHRYRKTGR